MKLTFAALLQDTANCSGVLPSLFSTSKFVSEQSRRSLKTRGSLNYKILPDSFRKLRLSSSFYLKTPLDISRILAPIRQLRSCGENWVTTMSGVTSFKTCSCQCCDNSLPCLILQDTFQSMVAFHLQTRSLVPIGCCRQPDKLYELRYHYEVQSENLIAWLPPRLLLVSLIFSCSFWDEPSNPVFCGGYSKAIVNLVLLALLVTSFTCSYILTRIYFVPTTHSCFA